eukprot:1152803-Pelagomonas_calceolata.AAC.3
MSTSINTDKDQYTSSQLQRHISSRPLRRQLVATCKRGRQLKDRIRQNFQLLAPSAYPVGHGSSSEHCRPHPACCALIQLAVFVLMQLNVLVCMQLDVEVEMTAKAFASKVTGLMPQQPILTSRITLGIP